MTFEDATIEVENIVGDLNIPLGVEGALLDVIEKLQKQYAPTVEMTAKEKENFLSIATSSVTFTNFYEQVLKQSTNIKLGIQASPELYKHLSEKELMQAWLHPESIEVVD